jgi:hypothetical protein
MVSDFTCMLSSQTSEWSTPKEVWYQYLMSIIFNVNTIGQNSKGFVFLLQLILYLKRKGNMTIFQTLNPLEIKHILRKFLQERRANCVEYDL